MTRDVKQEIKKWPLFVAHTSGTACRSCCRCRANRQRGMERKLDPGLEPCARYTETMQHRVSCNAVFFLSMAQQRTSTMHFK